MARSIRLRLRRVRDEAGGGFGRRDGSGLLGGEQIEAIRGTGSAAEGSFFFAWAEGETTYEPTTGTVKIYISGTRQAGRSD